MNTPTILRSSFSRTQHFPGPATDNPCNLDPLARVGGGDDGAESDTHTEPYQDDGNTVDNALSAPPVLSAAMPDERPPVKRRQPPAKAQGRKSKKTRTNMDARPPAAAWRETAHLRCSACSLARKVWKVQALTAGWSSGIETKQTGGSTMLGIGSRWHKTEHMEPFHCLYWKRDMENLAVVQPPELAEMSAPLPCDAPCENCADNSPCICYDAIEHTQVHPLPPPRDYGNISIFILFTLFSHFCYKT